MTRVSVERVIDEVNKAIRRGDTVRAVPMIRELVRQAGADPRSRLLQGLVALEFSQTTEAMRLLEQVAFELTGDDQRRATIGLARARLKAGDAEGALFAINPLCEEEDVPAPAIAVKAEALVAAGRPGEAEAVLASADESGKDGYTIALAKAACAFGTPAGDPALAAREDAAIASLATQREHVGVPAGALADICLALGELRARRGDDSAAANLFKRSAALNPTQADPRPYAQTVMRLIKGWDEKSIGRARRNETGEAAETERPVFVVGMPGGGTELVAALLGTHADVRVSDHPEALTAMVGRHLSQSEGEPIVLDPGRLSGKQLQDAGATYLSRTDPAGEAPARVVDAFPLNLHVLGVVAQVFPRARVVFVKRDAFDACLACLLTHREPRLLYANDPRALAVFAGGLRRLEDHWASVFAGERLGLRAHEVSYADLLAGGDSVRALFDFVGLDVPGGAEAARAEHGRWLRHGTGLEARFAGRMPELADAVRQAEIGAV